MSYCESILELPRKDEGGGPAGVNDPAEDGGGGPAGVVEGFESPKENCLPSFRSGVDGGLDEVGNWKPDILQFLSKTTPVKKLYKRKSVSIMKSLFSG
jgi:hypothetical protein